jgi:putative pyrroloquinoline-quinone binding quinoprotein
VSNRPDESNKFASDGGDDRRSRFPTRVRSRTAKGWLTAFDATTGKELWKYASPTPLVAALTATSGGVLFTGELNDDFLVLNAKTGDVFYWFNTGGSIGAGTVTYERNKKQYVAIASACRRSSVALDCRLSPFSPCPEGASGDRAIRLSIFSVQTTCSLLPWSVSWACRMHQAQCLGSRRRNIDCQVSAT